VSRHLRVTIRKTGEDVLEETSDEIRVGGSGVRRDALGRDPRKARPRGPRRRARRCRALLAHRYRGKDRPARSSTPKSTPSAAVGATHSVGSLDEARSAFERAVEGYANPTLKVGEVLEFSNNYYAEVKEKNTGIGAMELPLCVCSFQSQR
jgi:hypothetical protein